jgi:hypothetical protein
LALNPTPAVRPSVWTGLRLDATRFEGVRLPSVLPSGRTVAQLPASLALKPTANLTLAQPLRFAASAPAVAGQWSGLSSPGADLLSNRNTDPSRGPVLVAGSFSTGASAGTSSTFGGSGPAVDFGLPEIVPTSNPLGPVQIRTPPRSTGSAAFDGVVQDASSGMRSTSSQGSVSGTVDRVVGGSSSEVIGRAAAAAVEAERQRNIEIARYNVRHDNTVEIRDSYAAANRTLNNPAATAAELKASFDVINALLAQERSNKPNAWRR